jgi:hypothetical protein
MNAMMWLRGFGAGHTHAPSVLIGEKAGDLILA